MALLVLVIVEAMTAGILVLSTNARVVAASEIRARRAENIAEYAVQSVLSRWTDGGFDTLVVGEIVPAGSNVIAAPDASSTTTVERLASALYVIRAQARVGHGRAHARAYATATARLLDKRALLEESNAAISSAGIAVLSGARVDANSGTLPPTWPDSLCPGTDPLPPPAAMSSGEPAVLDASVRMEGPTGLDSTLASFDSVALGGVKWSQLHDIADRQETGTLTPNPIADDDDCRYGAAGNWGDPRAGSACADYFPLIYSPAHLVMSGGTGQGLLAIEGTFLMTAGAVFVGYIIARDGVLIEDGATIIGAVRTRRGAALFDRSAISYSRCAIARAASLAPASGRLVEQPRRFLPAF
jgi:hypothetical protein